MRVAFYHAETSVTARDASVYLERTWQAYRLVILHDQLQRGWVSDDIATFPDALVQIPVPLHQHSANI
jgi:hypothetical protein